ncbi:MAG: cobyrinate a,c-diamide synthase [Magnetococcales bacterium]|nr:cobyrinate a,c-diamide synthase [Magnetococcales bacterium]
MSTTHTVAPRIMISGARKSSGKTTLSIGLTAALTQRGFVVQPYKKGPDFIDPLWLSRASGRACRNLDFFIMGQEMVLRSFLNPLSDADFCLIEGNLGLFDGQDLEGNDCGAALAATLKTPVILVVNCQGMARGVAPLIQGHLTFPGGDIIAGVILNNVASPRQEGRLRAAVERYCDIPVVGALPRSKDVVIDERHLGLTPVTEGDQLPQRIRAIGEHVAQHIDLDTVIDIANLAPQWQYTPVQSEVCTQNGQGLTIGYALDQAFHFYYPENLEALQRRGVSLVPIDFLKADKLPEVDGLFIGGGFPEMFMDQLAANRTLMDDIRAQSMAGLPIYAECGGLMALANTIYWQKKSAQLAGALPIEITMHKKPQGYGFMQIRSTGKTAWPPQGVVCNCHEFHYSSITRITKPLDRAYEVVRGTGVDGLTDGILYRNILASYAHIHHLGAPGWVDFLIDFWRKKATVT